jgi:ribulose-phosphate 3-epimerase
MLQNVQTSFSGLFQTVTRFMSWSKISPSILSADFAALGTECEKVLACGADWIHVDIMDGHTVPNLTIGVPVVEALHKAVPDAFLDVHLMVDFPETYVTSMAKAGVQQLAFHIESAKDPATLIQEIKAAGMRAAIAIKPDTPADVVFPYLNQADMILIMTVIPGFGGQPFIYDMMDKIRTLRAKARELKLNLDLEADGGVNQETVNAAAEAGANVVVAGAVFRTKKPAEMIRVLRQALESRKDQFMV